MAKRCSPTPLNEKLYAKVKAEAMDKFESYPSIYANAWLVRRYKAEGGRYAKNCPKKKRRIPKWFREKWVDLTRPTGNNTWAPCGRLSLDMTRAEYIKTFPRCVALTRALKMTPAQRAKAVKTKRASVKKSKGAQTFVPVGD